MKKIYISLRISMPEELFEQAVALLSVFPFTGIEELTDEIEITFNREDYNPAIREEITALIKNLHSNSEIVSENEIRERNWNEEWEKNLTPVLIGDVAITPEIKKDEVNAVNKIIINPKMSFGTGHHATTRLMCGMMKDNISPGSFWIDAGTGTGILAILAVIYGAGKVLAFDNSEWAVNNTIENIRLNNVEDRIDVREADIFNLKLPEADGILANINQPIIEKMMKKFHKSLINNNGILIASGILKYNSSTLLEIAELTGFEIAKTEVEDEWVAYKFRAV